MNEVRGGKWPSICSISFAQKLPPIPRSQTMVGEKYDLLQDAPVHGRLCKGDFMLGILSQQPQLLATLSSIPSPHSKEVLLAT